MDEGKEDRIRVSRKGSHGTRNTIIDGDWLFQPGVSLSNTTDSWIARYRLRRYLSAKHFQRLGCWNRNLIHDQVLLHPIEISPNFIYSVKKKRELNHAHTRRITGIRRFSSLTEEHTGRIIGRATRTNTRGTAQHEETKVDHSPRANKTPLLLSPRNTECTWKIYPRDRSTGSEWPWSEETTEIVDRVEKLRGSGRNWQEIRIPATRPRPRPASASERVVQRLSLFAGDSQHAARSQSIYE